jgi:sterol desaturase/sphingolipid hydroxylase (fatty acid hydroxylase superfamily)
VKNHIDELVSAYIDNELSVEGRLAVEIHLQSCEQCNLLVGELLHVQTAVKTFFQEVPTPVGLENKVMEKLNLTSPLKSGLFTFGIILVLFIAVLLFFGSAMYKIISIFTKIAFGMFYTATDFVGTQPMTQLSFILFAIMLLVISSYSLRRLLHSNNAEGDESFG